MTTKAMTVVELLKARGWTDDECRPGALQLIFPPPHRAATLEPRRYYASFDEKKAKRVLVADILAESAVIRAGDEVVRVKHARPDGEYVQLVTPEGEVGEKEYALSLIRDLIEMGATIEMP